VKYTLISIKSNLDISSYLNKLKDFDISKEKIKMVDYIDNEESECIKYKIELLKAEDLLKLINDLDKNIIIQNNFYDNNFNIIEEPTIRIYDSYTD